MRVTVAAGGPHVAMGRAPHTAGDGSCREYERTETRNVRVGYALCRCGRSGEGAVLGRRSPGGGMRYTTRRPHGWLSRCRAWRGRGARPVIPGRVIPGHCIRPLPEGGHSRRRPRVPCWSRLRMHGDRFRPSRKHDGDTASRGRLPEGCGDSILPGEREWSTNDGRYRRGPHGHDRLRGACGRRAGRDRPVLAAAPGPDGRGRRLEKGGTLGAPARPSGRRGAYGRARLARRPTRTRAATATKASAPGTAGVVGGVGAGVVVPETSGDAPAARMT